MIRVTEYTPLEKGRLKVCLDNGEDLTLYRREAAQIHLEAGGSISEEDYRRLVDHVLTKRATKRAMHLLERMDRTEHELRGKLEDAFPAECVNAAVEYVARFHYLDDYRYACSFIRCRKDKYSRRQMVFKLTAKGVATELIDQALLEEYGENEDAQIRAMLKKRHFMPDMDRKEYAKAFRYLAGKGFECSAIRRNLREFGASDEAGSLFSE